MAFPEGWGRKCKLTIDPAKVDANLTDFPVLLTEDNLPEEMFDADGAHPALNGGGDIRFSVDVAGSTRLGCEVVSFVTDNDPANGSAEIWVKIPSVSSSVDTDFYVWWEKSGETQPVRTDTYGSDNVWISEEKGRWHMPETSGNILDSTGNVNDLTAGGTIPNPVTGKIGSGQNFNGTSDDVYISAGSAGDFEPGASPAFSISVWVKNSVQGFTIEKGASLLTASGNRGFLFYGRATSPYFNLRIRGDQDVLRTGTVTNVIWDDTWHYLCFVIDDANGFIKSYDNGEIDDTVTFAANGIGNVNNGSHLRAMHAAFAYYSGNIDELRFVQKVLTAEEIKTEYNNQNDPATFLTVGTPLSGTPGTPLGGVFKSPIFGGN